MYALPTPNQQSDFKPNYSPALALMTAFPTAQANTSPNYCTFSPQNSSGNEYHLQWADEEAETGEAKSVVQRGP